MTESERELDLEVADLRSENDRLKAQYEALYRDYCAACLARDTPRVPAGYSAAELERDNPHTAWLQHSLDSEDWVDSVIGEQ